ncbi:MAG: NUDIX domain-containing protein [Candidatus Wildermuthbacteria bacterium]|nr:NUDIX domain-containing protein [Candidatus Wildermuthbacteria bacterium]
MEHDIILQVGVKVLLRNKDGKYLLLRRSLEKYPEVEGRWDIVGGRINPGKTLFENLQREVQEETALNIVTTPRLVGAQDILRSKNRHVVRLTYVGEAVGEIALDTAEHDAYEWYTRDEIIGLTDLDMYLKELLHDTSLWSAR